MPSIFLENKYKRSTSSKRRKWNFLCTCREAHPLIISTSMGRTTTKTFYRLSSQPDKGYMSISRKLQTYDVHIDIYEKHSSCNQLRNLPQQRNRSDRHFDPLTDSKTQEKYFPELIYISCTETLLEVQVNSHHRNSDKHEKTFFRRDSSSLITEEKYVILKSGCIRHCIR